MIDIRSTATFQETANAQQDRQDLLENQVGTTEVPAVASPALTSSIYTHTRNDA